MTWIVHSNRYLMCALIVIAFTVTSCSAATSHVDPAGSVSMKETKFAGLDSLFNEKSMVNQNDSGNNSNPGGDSGNNSNPGGGNGTGNGTGNVTYTVTIHPTYSPLELGPIQGDHQGWMYASANDTDQGNNSNPGGGNGSGNGTGNVTYTVTIHPTYSPLELGPIQGDHQGWMYAPENTDENEHPQITLMGPSRGPITGSGPSIESDPAGDWMR